MINNNGVFLKYMLRNINKIFFYFFRIPYIGRHLKNTSSLFIEALLPFVFSALNELMEKTPIDKLSNFQIDDVRPLAPEKNDVFSSESRNKLRLHLGLTSELSLDSFIDGFSS